MARFVFILQNENRLKTPDTFYKAIKVSKNRHNLQSLFWKNYCTIHKEVYRDDVVLVFLLYSFKIYLTVPGLSCGTWDLIP